MGSLTFSLEASFLVDDDDDDDDDSLLYIFALKMNYNMFTLAIRKNIKITHFEINSGSGLTSIL